MTAERLQAWTPPTYRPSRLFGNRHAMNATLLVPRRRGALRHAVVEQVPVGDGDDVVLCHVSLAPRADAPTLFVVPGMTGSSRSNFVIGLARKALAAGIHVVRFDPRGCGGTEHLTARLAHVGLYDDVIAVMRHCVRRFALQRWYLAGFSMGGNLALHVGGRPAERAGLDLRGIAVVSPAIDVESCAERTDRDASLRPYRWRFVRDLCVMLRRHRLAWGLPVQDAALRRIRTVRGFDEYYMAPAWGFASVEDYWRSVTCVPRLAHLDVPAVAMAAADDVLVPFASLAPLRDAAPPVPGRFLSSSRGGHCAFLARSAEGGADRRWAENRIVDFVRLLEGGSAA